MFPKILELKLDRSHIVIDFGGYKLSLDPTPILREQLPESPLITKPSEEQYSFLHVLLFGTHNHLVQDPWDRRFSYFIGKNGNIFRSFLDIHDAKLSPLREVCSLKSVHGLSPGDYNVTLIFASEKFAVLCNGINEVLLYDTGDRVGSVDWNLIHTDIVDTKAKGFVLKDAQVDIIQGHHIINVALQHIHWDPNAQTHVTQILICNISDSVNGEWNFKIKNILTKTGAVYYCAFEHQLQTVILSSATKINYRESQKGFNDYHEYKSNYIWQQTEGHVAVKINNKHQEDTDSYNVKTTECTIEIKKGEDTVLMGSLYSSIDYKSTIWKMENNVLQVVLVKKLPGRWPFLIQNGPTEVLHSTDEQFINVSKTTSNLGGETEECDIPENDFDEIVIERIMLHTENVTHKVFLGRSPPLFCSRLKAGCPSAIIIWEDVDASVLFPESDRSNPDEWNLKHEGNLHAFGYVQASKKQKKFMDCSPDLSYSVICESQRHVFIYKANHGSANCLRNRNGPTTPLGKQHLVVLENSNEVLGLVASEHVITLLTEKDLFHIKVN